MRMSETSASLIQQRDELLAALKAVAAAYHLPESCQHGEEPDYCDGCRYATEKATAAAIRAAHDVIAKVEGR